MENDSKQKESLYLYIGDLLKRIIETSRALIPTKLIGKIIRDRQRSVTGAELKKTDLPNLVNTLSLLKTFGKDIVEVRYMHMVKIKDLKTGEESLYSFEQPLNFQKKKYKTEIQEYERAECVPSQEQKQADAMVEQPQESAPE
jgi:hypothetical protein